MVSLNGRTLPIVTDVEHDLSLVVQALEDPSDALQKEMRSVLRAIQEMDRVPDPKKFSNLMLRMVEKNMNRRMVIKPRKQKTDGNSPIHKQLAALRRQRKKFNVVIADPPWEYKDKADAGERGAEHKYPVMSISDIQELCVKDVCADDCVLFLWGTWPLIEEAKSVIRHWGFKYKTCGFVWVKANKIQQETDFVGGGHYTRSNSEYCLIAVRGKGVQRVSKSIRQVIRAVIGEHSQKPEEFYTRIAELYRGKLNKNTTLELFGRRLRRNMTVLGDDVQRYGSE